MSEKQEMEQRSSEEVIASKLSIKIGKISIEAEGASAVAITDLFPEYAPKLLTLMSQKNAKEFWSDTCSLIKEFISDVPSTAAPGKAVATDAKVPVNNNVPGNDGGIA